MAEKLNSKAVSFSLAAVSGIAYLLCALFFVITPQSTLGFFKGMFHGIDIARIASASVSFGNTILGFIEIIVLSSIAGWLFATIYNYLLNKMKGSKK